MNKEDRKINKLIDNLNERNKELNCLYKVDDILKDADQPIIDVLYALNAIIPYGFRYPDICAVRIEYGDIIAETDNYINTALKLQIPLWVEDKNEGKITIVYVKAVKSEKGIFLSQEHKLLTTISEKLGSFILYKRLRASLDKLGKIDQNEQHEDKPKKNKLREWLKTYHLTHEEIEKITQFKVNFRKGETICKQGAITSYVMLLVDGLTKNYLEGNQEKGFNFKIVTPFDFIGLTSLYGNNRYLFSGTALTPSTIYMIEKPLLKEIIATNPEFTARLMEWYGDTTEYHLKRLSCIANKQSLGRIAEILLYLKDDVFQSDFIPSAISRRDIAELAGMSTESAVRMLSELKKDKIITVTNRGITIINSKLLETLSFAG
ncbi:MAG: Crp/Fnr family transcriptional regulator [Bacteroidales bacterium]|nr:Crp/Fnr family transcriptional regulator [Bacteroidales bacterium]